MPLINGYSPRIGIDVNGTVQQYQAASTGAISAGDFVKHVQESETITTYTPEIPISYGYTYPDILHLEGDKYLIFGANGTSSPWPYYARIAHITETTVSYGAEFHLGSYYKNHYTLCKIDSSKVLFVVAQNAYVISISGDALSLGTGLTYEVPSAFIYSSDNRGNSAGAFSSTACAVAYQSRWKSGYEYRLNAVLLTISGTELSSASPINCVNGTLNDEDQFSLFTSPMLKAREGVLVFGYGREYPNDNTEEAYVGSLYLSNDTLTFQSYEPTASSNYSYGNIIYSIFSKSDGAFFVYKNTFSTEDDTYFIRDCSVSSSGSISSSYNDRLQYTSSQGFGEFHTVSEIAALVDVRLNNVLKLSVYGGSSISSWKEKASFTLSTYNSTRPSAILNPSPQIYQVIYKNPSGSFVVKQFTVTSTVITDATTTTIYHDRIASANSGETILGVAKTGAVALANADVYRPKNA